MQFATVTFTAMGIAHSIGDLERGLVNDALETFNKLSKQSTSLQVTLGTCALALSGLGVVLLHYAVTGPGQAARLIAGRWFRGHQTISYRQDTVKDIQDAAWSRQKGQYVVVVGDKGTGKTTAIATAFLRTIGVVEATIPAAASYSEVIALVRCQIAGSEDNSCHAGRVLWWYWLLTGGWRLVVILHASERRTGQDFADFPGPVRELAEQGHAVIVDASPNSIPPELLVTRRQKIVEVGAMSDEQFQHEFELLISILSEIGCEQLGRAIMGNIPAEAVSVMSDLAACLSTEEKATIIEGYVTTQVAAAVKLVRERVCDNASLSPIVEAFKDFSSVAIPKDVKLASPDKLFRTVLVENDHVLVPASPPVRFVLFLGLEKCPKTMEELKKMAAKLAQRK